MFDYEKCIKKLGDFAKMSKSKQRNFIEDLLNDKDFAEFLFKPKGIPNLSEVVGNLYAGLSRPSFIKALCNYIEDEGYDEFSRTHATFIYSVCNIALEANNDRATENANKKRSGEIGNKEFNEVTDKIEAYAKQINKLFKMAKKIVKKEAAELADESNLPESVVKSTLYLVPKPEMVDRYKIGRYLDSILVNIYDKVEEKGNFSSNANWKAFFRGLFGKDNIAEVATYLLLEGHNRRDKYEKSKAVVECWESLTEFALKQINDAPEQLRDQMIELYLKRISRMFSGGTYELRVDLLSIPELSGKRYPSLTTTINKYLDKLESILKR